VRNEEVVSTKSVGAALASISPELADDRRSAKARK